jgi:hypothetical protein
MILARIWKSYRSRNRTLVSRNQSRTVISTSSFLCYRQPAKCCFSDPNKWYVARCDPAALYCNPAHQLLQSCHQKLLDDPSAYGRELAGRHCWLKANAHITCRAHAAPMPFPCHAVPLRVYIMSFPFDLHSADVFVSHMPCHAHAAPVPCSCFTHAMPCPCSARAVLRPCRSESDFSRPRHNTAWAWHVWISLNG